MVHCYRHYLMACKHIWVFTNYWEFAKYPNAWNFCDSIYYFDMVCNPFLWMVANAALCTTICTGLLYFNRNWICYDIGSRED